MTDEEDLQDTLPILPRLCSDPVAIDLPAPYPLVAKNREVFCTENQAKWKP